MLKLHITIETDNAAFGDTVDSKMSECERIVRAALSLAFETSTGGALFDSNGNSVGMFEFESLPESDFDKFRNDIVEIVKGLKHQIPDESEYDGPDESPTLQVTFATDDSMSMLAHQTGDNSFHGACYGLPHWAVVYLMADDSPAQIAEDVASEWADLISQ